MIVVVTTGEYSDFRILAVVRVPEGSDWNWQDDCKWLEEAIDRYKMPIGRRLKLPLPHSPSDAADYRLAKAEAWNMLLCELKLSTMPSNSGLGQVALAYLTGRGYEAVEFAELFDNGQFREHHIETEAKE